MTTTWIDPDFFEQIQVPFKCPLIVIIGHTYVQQKIDNRSHTEYVRPYPVTQRWISIWIGNRNTQDGQWKKTRKSGMERAGASPALF